MPVREYKLTLGKDPVEYPDPTVLTLDVTIGPPIFSTNPFASVEFVCGATLDAETFVPTDMILLKAVVVLTPTFNFLG